MDWRLKGDLVLHTSTLSNLAFNTAALRAPPLSYVLTIIRNTYYYCCFGKTGFLKGGEVRLDNERGPALLKNVRVQLQGDGQSSG